MATKTIANVRFSALDSVADVLGRHPCFARYVLSQSLDRPLRSRRASSRYSARYFTFFTSPFFTPASGNTHIATTMKAAVITI